MKNLKRVLASSAIALAVAASSPVRAQFTGMYFLGDSLSDAGTYGARFTINPGLVWSQDFGQQYGFSIGPSNQPGGTDYAQGGARVALPSASIVPGFPQRPVTTQVSELLAAQPTLDPKAVYAVWIGANDVQQNLAAVGTGQITSAQAASNVGLAATQTAAQLARLYAAGARYIVVFNLPDIGKTPGGMAAGPTASAGLSQLSGVFNSTLGAAIGQLGFGVIPVNALSLFNDVLANPNAYGFLNTTNVACTVPNALNCTASTLVSPAAATTYVFADGIHPTPAAHAVIAQVVSSMINGPQQVAALGQAPIEVEQANFRAIDGRMWSSLNAPRTTKKFDAWVAYDYGNSDRAAGIGNGSADMNTVVIGGDMKLSDQLLVGLAFGYTEERGDFGGPGGSYKLRQPVGTVYAGYGDGPWYVGATVGGGNLDFTDVDRNIALGAAVRTERGEVHGNELTARLLGGYWLRYAELLHGPYGRVSYTRSKVNRYAENGNDSTALIFGEQKVYQLLWSAGWQAAGVWGNLRPFGRVTWEYDARDNDRTITVSSVNLGGSYSIPVAAKPDNNYALFNLGVSADFGGITGFLVGAATAARGDSNYYAITVGIRAPL